MVLNNIDGQTDANAAAKQVLSDLSQGGHSAVDTLLQVSAALASENIAPDDEDSPASEPTPLPNKKIGMPEREKLEKAAAAASRNFSASDREELLQRVRFTPRFGDNFATEDFEQLLVHCAKLGASDINLQTNEPVVIELANQYVPITERALRKEEITTLLTMLYGSHAESQMKNGNDLDKAYALRMNNSRYKFRVNITGCDVRGYDGSQTTLRTIRADPMRLSEMRVEQGIVDNYLHKDGLVVICGPTGSGKSSLLAGIICAILENPDSHKKIITYEKPIEYTYELVPKPTCLIAQTEIGRHLVGTEDMPEFERAVRNSLRRAPKILLVGETRDKATMEASLEAAQTGHLLYTTLHTNNSVGEALYRMLNLFPADLRESKLYEIVESLRLVVIQRLERSTQGGRVPIREFLAFKPAMLDKLVRCKEMRDIVVAANEFVVEEGQPMVISAENRYLEGLLPYSTYRAYCTANGRTPLPPQFDEPQPEDLAKETTA